MRAVILTGAGQCKGYLVAAVSISDYDPALGKSECRQSAVQAVVFQGQALPVHFQIQAGGRHREIERFQCVRQHVPANKEAAVFQFHGCLYFAVRCRCLEGDIRLDIVEQVERTLNRFEQPLLLDLPESCLEIPIESDLQFPS